MRVKSSPGNQGTSNECRGTINEDRKISNECRGTFNEGREISNVGREISNEGRGTLNEGSGNQKWIAGSSLNRNWKDCGNCLNFD